MSKTSHHVVPNSGGGWSVRRSGSSRASRIFDKQDEALAYARHLAQKEGVELYVHHSDGTIRKKDSYSRLTDPSKEGR